jgi:hypothetical protein
MVFGFRDPGQSAHKRELILEDIEIREDARFESPTHDKIVILRVCGELEIP